MIFDNSFNIISIVTLIALVVPLLTSFFNFLFQLYFKQYELYELAKREAFSNYVNDFSLYLYSSNRDDIYYKTLSSIHLLQAYFDIKPELQLIILEAFNQKSSKIFTESITELSKQLNKKMK